MLRRVSLVFVFGLALAFQVWLIWHVADKNRDALPFDVAPNPRYERDHSERQNR